MASFRDSFAIRSLRIPAARKLDVREELAGMIRACLEIRFTDVRKENFGNLTNTFTRNSGYILITNLFRRRRRIVDSHDRVYANDSSRETFSGREKSDGNRYTPDPRAKFISWLSLRPPFAFLFRERLEIPHLG